MRARHIISIHLSDAGSLIGTETATPLHSEVCLNGTWELKVDGGNQFVEVRVPGSYAGQNHLWGKDHWNVWDYPTKWFGKSAVYRKTFEVPKIASKQRVLIHFGGVRHVVRVEVNDVEVGKRSYSYSLFAFGRTDHLYVGKNVLLVKMPQDRTCGLFEDYNQNCRGICQDVFLKVMPDIRVTPDAFVQSPVSREQITYEVPMINTGDLAKQVCLRLFRKSV